ncbi:MAG: hypothetical protein HC908_10095 [Calothrix sp. SM1_7_51]|nr:hypothetical protein [Calothrix sp. SM1_7_51]
MISRNQMNLTATIYSPFIRFYYWLWDRIGCTDDRIVAGCSLSGFGFFVTHPAMVLVSCSSSVELAGIPPRPVTVKELRF